MLEANKEERSDATIAMVGTANEVMSLLKKEEGDHEFVVIKSRSEEDAREWRRRIGQSVAVPSTAPNCTAEECSVQVEKTDYKVMVSLYRPWLMNFGGEKEEMVVPAITVFFKCVRKSNAEDLAKYMKRHALSFITPDRGEFKDRVITSAMESSIVFDEEATKVRIV